MENKVAIKRGDDLDKPCSTKAILKNTSMALFLGLGVLMMPWSGDYQTKLVARAAKVEPQLSKYPSLKYPNLDYSQVLDRYPKDKCLLFGYGSLINKDSAARTVSKKAVASMQPAVAFGLKRLFNYEAQKGTDRILELQGKEGAYLNVARTDLSAIINGVLFEMSKEDLAHLVKRERGYDLVPVLVTLWKDVLAENPSAPIQVAYTFMATDELRGGVRYTNDSYEPIKKYLLLVQKGAASFGEKFLNYFNATTYLNDGTTSLEQ